MKSMSEPHVDVFVDIVDGKKIWNEKVLKYAKQGLMRRDTRSTSTFRVDPRSIPLLKRWEGMMDCVVFVAVMCYVQDRLIHCFIPVETTAPQFLYHAFHQVGLGGRLDSDAVQPQRVNGNLSRLSTYRTGYLNNYVIV